MTVLKSKFAITFALLFTLFTHDTQSAQKSGRECQEAQRITEEWLETLRISPDRNKGIEKTIADQMMVGIKVYNTQTAQLLSAIHFDAQINPLASTLKWVNNETIVLTWGAGSYVAEGALYSAEGAELNSFSGDAVDLSDNIKFLAVFTPDGAPLASTPGIRIYSLINNRVIFEDSKCRVSSQIKWKNRKATFSCRYTDDSATKEREVRVKLMHN